MRSNGLDSLDRLPSPAPSQMRLLRSLRLWIACARQSRAPRPVLLPLLGPGTGAFVQFMERIVAAWPDPFAAMPPCACRMTPDEALVLGLVRAAGAADRAGADRLLCEMLGSDERTRLWDAATGLAQALVE
jgi:hypothetical protein